MSRSIDLIPEVFCLLILASLSAGAMADVSEWNDRARENAHLRALARDYILSVQHRHQGAPAISLAPDRDGEEKKLLATNEAIRKLAVDHLVAYKNDVLKGRYDRSLARAPENIDAWRNAPDISNPGADLANFPNSAFTLPQGRAYIEFSPASWYGAAPNAQPQYNTQFLLRYGLSDDIELRIFGNGATWKGGRQESDGFSPIAFDTKIHLMDEQADFGLPAMGFEAYVQTELLGTRGFDQGTTGGFNFNFDQSLPYGIDAEYNLGSSQIVEKNGERIWQFNYQWALQKDILDGDVAVFIHGFYNDMTLPRLPRQRYTPDIDPHHLKGNPHEIAAVGGGALWTITTRWVVWAQASGGVTHYSPSVITDIGLAVAF